MKLDIRRRKMKEIKLNLFNSPGAGTELIYWLVFWYVWITTELPFWKALLWPYYAVTGQIW